VAQRVWVLGVVGWSDLSRSRVVGPYEKTCGYPGCGRVGLMPVKVRVALFAKSAVAIGELELVYEGDAVGDGRPVQEKELGQGCVDLACLL
jgi:hypothetical protein